MRTAFLALVLWASLVGVAVAERTVTIANNDAVRRVVTLSDGNRTWQITLQPGEERPDICRACIVDVEQIGSVEAVPGDRISIRNDDLVIEN